MLFLKAVTRKDAGVELTGCIHSVPIKNKLVVAFHRFQKLAKTLMTKIW